MSRHGWNPNKPFTHDEQVKAVVEHGEKIVYSARYVASQSLHPASGPDALEALEQTSESRADQTANEWEYRWAISPAPPRLSTEEL